MLKSTILMKDDRLAYLISKGGIQRLMGNLHATQFLPVGKVSSHTSSMYKKHGIIFGKVTLTDKIYEARHGLSSIDRLMGVTS